MNRHGHFRRYSPAYIRGLLYAIIAFLTAFNAEFDPLKNFSSEQLRNLTWMAWVLAWAKIFGATAVTMRAFCDGTIERINAQPVPAAEPTAPKPTS